MTTSAKISKNFVSTLIGMGQPLETFCNKNLSIPFFSESQQETSSSSKKGSFYLIGVFF